MSDVGSSSSDEIQKRKGIKYKIHSYFHFINKIRIKKLKKYHAVSDSDVALKHPLIEDLIQKSPMKKNGRLSNVTNLKPVGKGGVKGSSKTISKTYVRSKIPIRKKV
ncbi:PREDICTED: uncharacterized protein LOC108568345 [Nicrophorus vespilloides]|uniref:Uncharacterized protein LOC108568345 n=1 Tax=Nicrophorus vespilloides TaxID=110193 RepID=A0ABM1NDF4_NICVS|nr:PREDICTED: uncharacterized protein LOC108568345 [Nicrophorus vespilloides]